MVFSVQGIMDICFWILGVIQIFQINVNAQDFLKNTDVSTVLSEEPLPGNVVPIGYVLDLHPIPNDAYFKGRVIIDLLWQEESNKIVLHADPDLVIYQTELLLKENGSPVGLVRILRTERNADYSWYIIHLRKSLNAGTEAQLSLTFTGQLNIASYEGLFLTTYEEHGVTKHFVGSFLKPNFSRKVFPCYDEPGYKTPFKVSVVRKNTMTALSNMPIEQSEMMSLDPTWVRDFFQETLPMTTHNLGIFISEFTSITLQDSSDDERNFDAPIQVWAPSEILEAIENSTDIISKTINGVGEYLGLPYPLPKLDFVLGPGLDSSNWGLIFQGDFVEPQVLYNIVFQWIGNLVTPGLWIDEVISDGLRTFITGIFLLQDNDNQEMVLEHALPALHDMSFKQNKVEDYLVVSNIPQNHDAIKIAMILRMLNYTLGEATLKQGLQRFISETKYKTYEGSSLWNAITDQAYSDGVLKDDLAVSTIAESWIALNRLPVLTVKRNYRDNSATFTQHIPNALNAGDDDSKHKWIIPIVVIKEERLDFGNTTPITWLKQESVRLSKIAHRDRFIITNPELLALSPVNYDERNWKLILQFLQKEENVEKIPPVTRSKLLYDALYLAYEEKLSFKTALDMILFLEKDDSPIVWKRFFAATKDMGQYISDSTPLYEKFLKFIRQWVFAFHERLEGNLSENDEAKYVSLKTATKEALCGLGYQPCLDEARNSIDNWIMSLGSNCKYAMNIISNACYVIRWGSDEDFEVVLQHFVENVNNSTLNIDGHALFNGIVGCSDQPWKVERILNVTMFESSEEFSDVDIQNILEKIVTNAVGYKTVFEYLIQNWDALKERFEDKEDLWINVVTLATCHFKTQEGLDAINTLYTKKSDEFGSAESAIKKCLKSVDAEVSRSRVIYPAIEEWLDNFLQSHEDNTNDSFFLFER